jgi:hypothetical protein
VDAVDVAQLRRAPAELSDRLPAIRATMIAATAATDRS